MKTMNIEHLFKMKSERKLFAVASPLTCCRDGIRNKATVLWNICRYPVLDNRGQHTCSCVCCSLLHVEVE